MTYCISYGQTSGLGFSQRSFDLLFWMYPPRHSFNLTNLCRQCLQRLVEGVTGGARVQDL